MDPGTADAAAQQQLILAGFDLRVECSMALVAACMLWYDHLLTFSDEITYIWQRKMSPLSGIYLANRYFAPPAFAVCIYGIFFSDWTTASCARFARFEGATTLVTVLLAELILIFRVYAVHAQRKWTLCILIPIYVTQASLMTISLHTASPIILPTTPTTHASCILGDPEKVNQLQETLFWLLPSLLWDSVVVILLVVGIYSEARKWKNGSMYDLILKDGFLYFAVVFFSNLTWVITSLNLRTDLSEVFALCGTALTNIMIGRLTINLRKHSSITVYTNEFSEVHEMHIDASASPSQTLPGLVFGLPSQISAT